LLAWVVSTIIDTEVDAFIDLLGINDNDIKEWKPVKESDLTEVTQLLIPLDETRTV